MHVRITKDKQAIVRKTNYQKSGCMKVFLIIQKYFAGNISNVTFVSFVENGVCHMPVGIKLHKVLNLLKSKSPSNKHGKLNIQQASNHTCDLRFLYQASTFCA